MHILHPLFAMAALLVSSVPVQSSSHRCEEGMRGHIIRFDTKSCFESARLVPEVYDQKDTLIISHAFKPYNPLYLPDRSKEEYWTMCRE